MKTTDMMYASLFTAIVAVLGILPPIMLPFIPVPITAQTLGVMLAGTILGARLGGLSLFLFVMLVVAGAPILSGGRGGLGTIIGPSGGFILSWPIAAYVIGLLVQKFMPYINFWKLFLINIFGGIIIVYMIGIPWLAILTDLSLEKAAAGSAIYLPGDTIKAIIVSTIAPQLLKRAQLIRA
ncbi:biotin transporter BioY [Alkalihalobacillus sp. AL-G]|uniref:biotin transporter BioY n=1 Tax=Alkalihalobacillus sp. AL-G TaxID=2926399 RepID=UPI00272B7285|nr:biotin transporter BioY [Alkalihalobacillus sp. AL-G]WLD91705.1 biotin transporter BioY [Alkalihalobacillus sp. AL-G]